MYVTQMNSMIFHPGYSNLSFPANLCHNPSSHFLQSAFGFLAASIFIAPLGIHSGFFVSHPPTACYFVQCQVYE